MKGSPLNYRCGDCTFPGGPDHCRILGTAPLIATVERPIELATDRDCEASGQDDFSSHCRATARLRFERVSDARTGSPVPGGEFLLEFEYAYVGGEALPAPPIGAAPRVVFAFPVNQQSASGAGWNISAICPLPQREK